MKLKKRFQGKLYPLSLYEILYLPVTKKCKLPLAINAMKRVLNLNGLFCRYLARTGKLGLEHSDTHCVPFTIPTACPVLS